MENPPFFFFNLEPLEKFDNDASPSSPSNNSKNPSEEKTTEVKPVAVFKIKIPSINLVETVYEGTEKRILMSGPGHIRGTAYPGKKGNCAISGHRVSFGAPFYNLHKLNKGDKIFTYYQNREYIYQVIWLKRVKPGDTWVIAPTEIPSLTLTTCDPPFSAKYRLVVRAVLIKKEGNKK